MLDSLGIAAIAGELKPFLGGFVQRTIQTGPLSHAVRLHARGRTAWLYMTIDPEFSGLWLTERGLTPADEPKSPLALLARKWIQDSRLMGLYQPTFERRLDLTFTKQDDDGREYTHTLIVEATGRLANIILVDRDGVILDSAKRVPSRINRVRQILPRRPYAAPPERDLASPLEIEASAIATAAAVSPDELVARALPRLVRGISPLAAREISYRAVGRAAATMGQIDPVALVRELVAIAAPITTETLPAWAPSVTIENGIPVAAAPYRLSHAVTHEAMDAMSAAIDRVQSQAARVPHDRQRHAIVDPRIARARDRAIHRLSALNREGERSHEQDALRESGELILAYAHWIQVGASEAQLGDRSVTLNPKLTAVQNAKDYFKRYAAARDSARRIPRLIAEAEANLRELDEAIDFISLAADAAVARSIAADLESRLILPAVTGVPTTSRRHGQLSQASGRYVRGRAACLVGRSARENEAVTFVLAKPSDLWLHARGVTGSHVILQSASPTAQSEDVEWAAGIAAYFSRARGEAHVRVDVVERRHVRRAKGGSPGMVTYSGERTLSVRPTQPQAGRVAP